MPGLPANRLDCPRCRLTENIRPPIWPSGRVRPFGGRVQVEMVCGECNGTWWSRHRQALVMHDSYFETALADDFDAAASRSASWTRSNFRRGGPNRRLQLGCWDGCERA